MKDHYSTLGVQPNATDADIKTAYRKLAKANHPDVKPGDPEAETRFKEINEAHEILKDPQKRAQYDAARTAPPPHQGFNWHQGDFHGSSVNLDEILRDIRRSRNPFPEDARNRDIVVSYTVTLEEAFLGKDATLRYNLPGKDVSEIQFKVPPGIQDGISLRFQGKGDDALDHVPAGNLMVRINIMPHMSFVRMGANLITSTTVDYMDAMLGVEKEIPTVDGGKIKMRVPAGIMPGQSLRAQGKGMPVAGGQRGDMMVEVIIQPVGLTLDQRDLIQRARDLRVP